MKKDRIEINKNLIPYSFDITLGGEIFEIGVNYNEFADMFTLSLAKDRELICSGEPIVYGVPLFKDIYVVNILLLELYHMTRVTKIVQ